MRKKLLLLTMGLTLALSVVGCSKKKEDQSYKAEDYVTLGQYTGIEVKKETVEVTDDQLQSQIDSFLEQNAIETEITDRAVKDGDKVHIVFTGYMDGEAFEGGASGDSGSDLTIGSNQFIPGFEEGLIGAEVGQTVDVNVTFPDPYENNPDFAGKDAKFVVEVQKITEVTIPELTDELVADKTDYDTIDAYKEATKADLLKTAEENAEYNKQSNILQAVIDNATFSSLPQDEVETYANQRKSQVESMATMYFGLTLDQYVEKSGYTMEEFEAECKTYGENVAKQNLVYQAIAAKEGMEISDEEYSAGVTDFLSQSQYSSYETADKFEEAFGKDEIRKVLLYNKVMDFITEKSVEVAE